MLVSQIGRYSRTPLQGVEYFLNIDYLVVEIEIVARYGTHKA